MACGSCGIWALPSRIRSALEGDWWLRVRFYVDEKRPPCAGVLLSVLLRFYVGPEHLVDPRLEALATLFEERHHIAIKPQRDLLLG